MTLKERYPLKKFTTLGLGGPARYFVAAKSEGDLQRAVKFARKWKLPSYGVGEGSNLVVSDDGFGGVIIRNRLEKFSRRGKVVSVGAGNNLLKFVFRLNRLGLSGMERMAGIPGTIGGAIYGCAGAYGQEIKDRLVSVSFFDGDRFRKFTKRQCQFGYRSSVFKKHSNWIITQAVFKFSQADPAVLWKISLDTIKLRQKKYPPGLRCPGSFFKNLKVSEILPQDRRRVFLSKVPPGKIMYGKIPVGYLLEEVRAKGRRSGSIRVAAHHANLIYNAGKGSGADVRRLAQTLKALVKKKFGITIEEEVQYLGF